MNRQFRGSLRAPAVCLCPLPIPSVFGGVAEDEKVRARAAAGQWLNHRASFFELRDLFLGDSIDWHCDYSSGVIGPKRYSALINYRDASRVGDVKYIWELNRLQQLVVLALASVWTKSEDYDREIQSQTASWHRQNPFMRGLNWKSPLEAAMRLISWALVAFVKQPSGLVEIFHKEFIETLYQHQYFISKFYSKHSSANNHLIGEMAGLYIASIFWPYYRESSSWRQLARRKLIEECLSQVEADGVGKERATEYQLFILEFFLLAGALGQAVGENFPEEYWHRVASMATYLAAISDRNGNLPMCGDGDSAEVVRLPGSTRERVQSLLRVCRIHNNEKEKREDLRSRFLLWGQEPRSLSLPCLSASDQSLLAFPKGGYYVLTDNRGTDDEVKIVFDAGPLGMAPLYAHGHADALSFWLSYGGREFLIDPGTFCYYTHPEWRAYFRSTAAHNTMRIDGQDQSVTGGRFLWSHVARSQIEHCETQSDFVSVKGFHDGYQRLADPVIHRRELRLHKKTRVLAITDLVECGGSHDVEIFFHFSEQCEVSRVAPTSFEAVNGDRRLSLRLDPRFEAKLYRGAEQPIVGWVSRSFGVKEPSFTVAARTRIGGSTQFVTEIDLL